MLRRLEVWEVDTGQERGGSQHTAGLRAKGRLCSWPGNARDMGYQGHVVECICRTADRHQEVEKECAGVLG